MTSPDPVPRKGSRAKRRDSAEAVSWPVRVAASWSVRILVLAAGVYLLLRVFEKVSLVAFVVIVALLISSVLHPVERRLRTLVRFRALSTVIVLFGFVLLFGLVVWFVTAQIQDHSSQLADQLTQVTTNIKNYLKTGPLHLKDADLDKYASSITTALKNNQSKLVSGALSTAATVLEALAGVLLTLFTLFFFLKDGEHIWGFVLGLFPSKARARADFAARQGWTTLGGYVRGQVTIAAFHAVTIYILLFFLRVPLSAALAALVFIGAFIPIIGIVVAGSLCVGVTLLEHGLTRAIVVAVVIVLLVQSESHLLQPVIMSRTVHIHPLAVVLAVAAGTTLYGIVGALIAVPLVSFTNTFIRAAHGDMPEPDADNRRSGDPPPAPPPNPEQRRPEKT